MSDKPSDGEVVLSANKKAVLVKVPNEVLRKAEGFKIPPAEIEELIKCLVRDGIIKYDIPVKNKIRG